MSVAGEAKPSRQRPLAPAQPSRKSRLARLRLHLANIYRLTIKELRSFRSDPTMLLLVVYAFTIAIYAAATGASTEAKNLSVGIVDEDHSDLSRRISDGLTPPTFKPAITLTPSEIDAAMNGQRVIFVIEIPPNFQADILAGRQPAVQIDVDATAAAQAFNGLTYIQNVVTDYVTQFITGREANFGALAKMVTEVKFNPNLKSSWFTAVMQVISNLTMITVMLSGAALIREREQGTVEHLLVMPVVPSEIMLAKILANGIVIVVSTALSLAIVVEWWLQVPVSGSRLLFLGGACVYVFTVAALGIALGTVASTMAQFGLLSIPVLLVMMLLSGSTTPLESMPVWLQYLMKTISPTPHFVIFSQGVLYRSADATIVWPEILITAAIGSVFFGLALYRFRRVIFNG
ncbi:putative transporter subunit: membrane component of ABC superfamily [Bradyrhizobium sp. STM 3843]|uniref:ABC transporter permease n=1 Tax=Bradyrhizobium sp. STM 3843 TaxID=551947 RepID=UPI00024033C0|nr:ABC transporter permease [Bradyrhizobium sp. STM 3843]CCE07699.1 putative transporter subunit: membrane component of ABC superfamily [Bradyrhizobium sp. STM 3843]